MLFMNNIIQFFYSVVTELCLRCNKRILNIMMVFIFKKLHVVLTY